MYVEIRLLEIAYGDLLAVLSSCWPPEHDGINIF